ncbi:unannotated protein [freshwater metagenome]|uniref:Unannotated protein n=1 Tax=freshwater metagenome TaxID=449393 RepID=A0A6J7IT67_9ZZZZ
MRTHLAAHSDCNRELEATICFAINLTNDDVLRHVDKATSEVAGVCSTQSSVGQTLASTVRGDEVLQNRETLTEVRLDRTRNDLALRVCHQATHAGNLTNLHEVTAGTRVDHDVDRIVDREVRPHRFCDLVGSTSPNFDELLTTLGVGDQAAVKLLLYVFGFVLSQLKKFALARWGNNVLKGNRDTRARGPAEAECLE